MTIAHAQSHCGEHPCCDASLSPDARADVLLAQLTLPENPDLLWGDEHSGPRACSSAEYSREPRSELAYGAGIEVIGYRAIATALANPELP
jgi:hypothetical protein